MKMTESVLRGLKREEKSYFKSAGDGLYVEVLPDGRKRFISKVSVYNSKKFKMTNTKRTLGWYPEISLKDAREKNAELQNVDIDMETVLFKDIAEEWYHTKILPTLSPSYTRTVRIRMDKFIIPMFGNAPIKEISPMQILNMCRQCEAQGMTDTAHRLQQFMRQIFDFAIATDRIEINPAMSISKALVAHVQTCYASITDDSGIGLLMREIDSYPRSIMRLALFWSAITAVRPGNVRQAEWSEIDTKNREWNIPAEKMKMKIEHTVHLSDWALDILDSLRKMTGTGRWLFPSARNDGRSMSDNSVRVALRAMGYEKEEMTAHGFRAMFSTVCNRNGWNPDAIEEQLAHRDKDVIRRKYNRERYFAERARLMDWWSSYLLAMQNNDDIPPK